MTRPEDVPEWAWDEAEAIAMGFYLAGPTEASRRGIARALLAAEQRGAEREGEACAKLAEQHVAEHRARAVSAWQASEDGAALYGNTSASAVHDLANAIRGRKA